MPITVTPPNSSISPITLPEKIIFVISRDLTSKEIEILKYHGNVEYFIVTKQFYLELHDFGHTSRN